MNTENERHVFYIFNDNLQGFSVTDAISTFQGRFFLQSTRDFLGYKSIW